MPRGAARPDRAEGAAVTLHLVPPRPAGSVLCPTCADQGRYPWVLLVDGHCPFNQRRDRRGKVRQGGTCRTCWGHTSKPSVVVCVVCDIRLRLGTPRTSSPHERTDRSLHGVSGYSRGCRCAVCRDAQRQRVAAWKQRRKAA